MTDLQRWHLDIKEGRQRWFYDATSDARSLKNVVDRFHLGLDTESPPASNPRDAACKGATFYSALQTDDGHWAHDYGGPMFLLPGTCLVIACYITATELKAEQKVEMIRYLRSHQNGDGGWGSHIEGPSGIFGTGLNYVALRLLGVPATDFDAERAGKFLQANGGCTWIAQWGKVWLAALGVYSWDGINPIPPELWILPYWVPFHPGRWWCHCRLVYLPMSYLYGARATAKETPLIRELRNELYCMEYGKVDWAAARDQCSPLDVYQFSQKPKLLNYLFAAMNAYERVHSSALRKLALDACLEHMRFEDWSTKYICIGPVNKTLNMLCAFFSEGAESETLKRHRERIDDYLWLSADGMKMQGYNGSQLWDTVFSVQALADAGLSNEAATNALYKAYSFIDLSQVPEDVPHRDKYFRHISKGAWPFSTRDHGWPIADCTGEAITATLAVRGLPGVKPLDEQRYLDAVNVILSLQNTDGGWATYETQRSTSLVEMLNPAEIFYGIMLDYSYTELSASAMVGLCHFRELFPKHRTSEIQRALKRGLAFVKSMQRTDGSWYGSWGVCFLYGTWFGVRALRAMGETLATSEPLRRACSFALSKQHVDGGWGEKFESCSTWEYQDNARSQVVGTAWALLTLLLADYPDRTPMQRGAEFLIRRQLPNGDWPQEDVTGVFSASCSVAYTGYKNIFPVWALGLYAKKFPTVSIVARL